MIGGKSKAEFKHVYELIDVLNRRLNDQKTEHDAQFQDLAAEILDLKDSIRILIVRVGKVEPWWKQPRRTVKGEDR